MRHAQLDGRWAEIVAGQGIADEIEQTQELLTAQACPSAIGRYTQHQREQPNRRLAECVDAAEASIWIVPPLDVAREVKEA